MREYNTGTLILVKVPTQLAVLNLVVIPQVEKKSSVLRYNYQATVLQQTIFKPKLNTNYFFMK